MKPDSILIAFVLLAWGFACLSIKISHLMNGRSLSGGPSLMPLLLVVPPASIAVGMGLNFLYPMLGTVSVAIVYIGFVVIGFGAMWITDIRSSD